MCLPIARDRISSCPRRARPQPVCRQWRGKEWRAAVGWHGGGGKKSKDSARSAGHTGNEQQSVSQLVVSQPGHVRLTQQLRPVRTPTGRDKRKGSPSPWAGAARMSTADSAWANRREDGVRGHGVGRQLKSWARSASERVARRRREFCVSLHRGRKGSCQTRVPLRRTRSQRVQHSRRRKWPAKGRAPGSPLAPPACASALPTRTAPCASRLIRRLG